MTTEREFASPDDLGPSDRLRWLIGGVCRNDVLLELSLRWLFNALTTTDGEPARFPTSFAALVSHISTALAASNVSLRTKRLAEDVLTAAVTAHAERNRTIHDMWMPDRDVEDSWLRQRMRPDWWAPSQGERQALEAVEACGQALFRAHIRVSAVAGLVWTELPHLPGGELDDSEHDLKVASDLFDFVGDTSGYTLRGWPDEEG